MAGRKLKEILLVTISNILRNDYVYKGGCAIDTRSPPFPYFDFGILIGENCSLGHQS